MRGASLRLTTRSNNFGNCLWRQTGSLPTTGCGQSFVEVVEVIGAKPAQRDVTEYGVEVAIDEPRVPIRGCGSDVSSLVRHPRSGQELANRDRPLSRRRAGDAFAVEPGGDGFGLGAVMADRDPPATFATGQRVQTVVGDDIEAGLAFNDVGHPSSSTISEPTRRCDPAARGGKSSVWSP